MGTRSWPLGESALRIFGRDDFHEFERIALLHKIPIHHIHNDGFGSLERELHRLSGELFGRVSNREGDISSRGREHEY